jgi:hypothetical protein
MTTQNDGEFRKIVNYAYERFDPKGHTRPQSDRHQLRAGR